jgi:hypothetical protein
MLRKRTEASWALRGFFGLENRHGEILRYFTGSVTHVAEQLEASLFYGSL